MDLPVEILQIIAEYTDYYGYVGLRLLCWETYQYLSAIPEPEIPTNTFKGKWNYFSITRAGFLHGLMIERSSVSYCYMFKNGFMTRRIRINFDNSRGYIIMDLHLYQTDEWGGIWPPLTNISEILSKLYLHTTKVNELRTVGGRFKTFTSL